MPVRDLSGVRADMRALKETTMPRWQGEKEVEDLIDRFRMQKYLELSEFLAKERRDEAERRRKEAEELAIKTMKRHAVPFDDDYAQAGLIYPEFIHYEVQDGWYTERLVSDWVPANFEPIYEASSEAPVAVIPTHVEKLDVPMPRMKRVTELIWKEWQWDGS